MYDAIVIGARCAGSPTAMLLARAGHRVLLLDKSTFPSDKLSTHYIQPSGVKCLEEWGLLDAVVATNTPPITHFAVFSGDDVLMEPPMDGVAYCPRRYLLDKILVDGAVAAGAEMREGFKVDEIAMDGETVTGIVGHGRDGAPCASPRATSSAPRAITPRRRRRNAPKYREREALTGGYYSYWSGIDLPGAEIHISDRGGVLAFPTNDGRVCIAAGRARDQFHAYRADIEATFFSILDASPNFAAKVRAGKREERWMGTADVPNFFRKPWGPGWALVGDAGYMKDPTTGFGIADAFRDAGLLAKALDDVLSGRAAADDALGRVPVAARRRRWPDVRADAADGERGDGRACGMRTFDTPHPRPIHSRRWSSPRRRKRVLQTIARLRRAGGGADGSAPAVMPGLTPIPQGEWPDLVGRLLALRGITDAATAETFLGKPAAQPDCSALPDIDIAIDRLVRATRTGERVAVYGDFDVDGVTSAAQLCEALSSLGASPVPYIPDRFSEGYGLNIAAIESLHGDGATLLVTADCGTSSIDEVARARELGMDVIILDHHTVPPELPDATALVNPRVLGAAPGGLLELATAGLAFHVAAALHEACDRPFDAGAYLDVAALGTVCDMAPLIDENRRLVRAGLPAHRAHAAPRPARADGGLARRSVGADRRGHRLQARPAPQRRRPHRAREARAGAADDARRRSRPRAGAAARRAQPRAAGAHAAGRRYGDGDGRRGGRAAGADHGRPRRLLVRHRRADRVEAREPLRPARRRVRARRRDEPRELPQHRRVSHHGRDALARPISSCASAAIAPRRASRSRRRGSMKCAST